MTRETYKEYIQNEFKNYTDAYDPGDLKIKLKIDHTYRVAGLCEEIAMSIGLSDTDVLIAWTCGMLHDVGRFEQVRIYGTFSDAKSVNHATFGADLLFEKGLYEKMVPEQLIEGQRALIERAIRVHNMFRVPEDMSERENVFSNILRDADKIDILKVNVILPMEEIYGVSREELVKSSVSEDVKTAFNERRCAKRTDRTSAIDFVVGHICLLFELVYPKSIEIAHKQGAVYQILDFKSEKPETREWFDYMKAEVNDYITERMN